MLFKDYIGKMETCTKCGNIKKIVAQYTRDLEENSSGPSFLLFQNCAAIKLKSP